jgi:ABC-type multidrug transport system ATPase subunit
MQIRYVEIENFKVFGSQLYIDLGHPAVLIGPNNAGKTSVIQALALWNQGIKAWYEKKGKPKSKKTRERLAAGTGINRLNILDVPVAETRFFWNNTRVRRENKSIPMTINVGVKHGGAIEDCRMIFTYRDSEIIYCRPCEKTLKNSELLKLAATLQFNLLYPMSGIMSGTSADTEETPLPDGRINLYLGQGQTAQVLRNICYKVVEQDGTKQLSDWDNIAALIKRIFLVDLKKPVFNKIRGSLVMTYRQDGIDNELDISQAGRGMQQMLLVLAYLYWHKESVLLIDEPDAHLEILRQKQVYEILKDVAEKNGSQVIIATHSEVILDEAMDTNLTLLLYGKAENLAQKKDMRNALRSFGIEHYYKAKVHPRILYIEGTTDIKMLHALAEKLKHEAAKLLSGRINCHYTCDVVPENTLENRLDRAGGAYGNFWQHFFALKQYVPELKGIAIFDRDKETHEDKLTDDLAVLYWQNYELENYFISPDILCSYARDQFSQETAMLDAFCNVVDQCLLQQVFAGDDQQLQEFHKASPGLKRTLLKNVKMSGFTDKVFTRFAQEQKQPILLNEGEYYKLVGFLNADEIVPEVRAKLDMLVKYLKLPDGRI